MKKLNIFLTFVCITSLFACNLTNEVEIDLPEYDPQLVIECYLEPGKNFRAILTRTAPYFGEFPTDPVEYLQSIQEENATVTIKYGSEVIDLTNDIQIDFQTGKLFNYTSSEICPLDYDTEFECTIVDSEGFTSIAKTRIMRPIELDSVVVEFMSDSPADSLARILTYFEDEANVDNYYRRQLHKGSLDSLEFEFVTNDQILDGGPVVFGTNFEYAPGDTVINTVYHIDRPYYDFLNSVTGAFFSNGNPFAQPGNILGNFEGEANPIGIFTGVTFTREETIIEK